MNWLSPVKIRRTLIGGDKKMLVYNDLEPTEKVKIYGKGIDRVIDDESIYQMRIGFRIGDIWVPKLDSTEALYRLAKHFWDCIEGNDEPITSSISGLRVVQMMEAATKSMYNNGHPEKLN